MGPIAHDDTLPQCLDAYAALCLLARHWPKADTHTRHHAAMHTAGLLCHCGIDPTLVPLIVEMAATLGGDEEVLERISTARNTVAKFRANQRVTGGKKLAAIIGEPVVKQLYEWPTPSALVLDPGDPLPTARRFVEHHHTINGVVTLRRQQDVFYRYTAETGAHQECDDATLRAPLGFSLVRSGKLSWRIENVNSEISMLGGTLNARSCALQRRQARA